MKGRFHGLGQALAGTWRSRGGWGRPPGGAAGAPFDFDALARDVADGLTRREAMRRLGVGLGTAVLASVGVAAPALAGPNCPKGQTNCSGTCVNLSTDAKNCGACG